MRKNRFKHLLLPAVLLFVLFACKSKKEPASSPVSAGKSIDNPHKKNNNEDNLKFQSTFYNACKEKIKGNVEIAETLFKECLRINPGSAVVKYELAHIYHFGGLHDQALKYAREAATTEPRNEWYQLLYIECLHNKHLYSEAVTAYEKLVKTFPEHQVFYEELATEYIYAGKTDKALKTYEEIEKKFGKSEHIALSKVRIYKQTKKWAEAEAELKALIKENAKEAQYYTYLAELYQETNQPEKAFQTYQEILKTDPDNPFIHLALADYYRSLKKDEEFLKELKIAFNSEDLDVDNKIKIMMSYYSLTEQYPQYKENAYELCRIMLKVHPADARAYSMYADFLYRDRKLKEAKMAFEKVLEFDKSKYLVWNQLMLCESELGDYNSLLKHSSEAMDLFPNQAIPYFLNGVSNLRLKNFKTAIESLKDGQEFVYENEPLQTQFLVNLGEAYNEVKEFQKSDSLFDEALKYEPENAMILNNYAYYLSLRKVKLDYAEKLSKRSLELQPGSISYIDTYGWIFYQQGKYEDAKLWIEKALQAGADNRPAILEHYGDILFRLKDAAKALEYWQKAKDKGGNSEALEKKIAEKKMYE